MLAVNSLKKQRNIEKNKYRLKITIKSDKILSLLILLQGFPHSAGKLIKKNFIVDTEPRVSGGWLGERVWAGGGHTRAELTMLSRLKSTLAQFPLYWIYVLC